MAPRQRIALASDLIKTAETLKATTTNASLFQMLPKRLATFLHKYPPSPFAKYSDKSTATNAEDANPFLPNKHPITNKWHAPKYSLRRQSDIYKEAYKFGIEHLLPKLGNHKKFYEEKYLSKTPVKGSLEFKLSKGERIRDRREKEVQEAIANADQVMADAKGAAARRRLELKKSQRPGFF